MKNLHATLDAMTDEAVDPAMEAVAKFCKVDVEDREALSDWLQDRFHSRIRRSIEDGAGDGR